VLLCLKTKTDTASKMSCFFKKLAEEHVPKKRLSVNVSHAVFCLFDLLTFEDGTDRLS